MISGAREARPSWLGRLFARAAARELSAFVVPGVEVARARGVDVEAAGLHLSPTPRHASVLLLVGELPEGLREAAAVAYSQMPRPRAVLAVGAGDVAPLPEPDVRVDLKGGSLSSGVEELRRLFAGGAFHPDVADFEPAVVQAGEGGEEDSHEHGADEEEEAADESEEEEQDGGQASAEQEEKEEPAGEEGGEQDQDSEEDGERGEGDQEIPEPVPGEDFMSMVSMTQSMPRSGDGLPMEWVQAPFGPLFPGLPAGLTLYFTLDGDTVAQAGVKGGIEGWPLERLTGPVEGVADRLGRLDPLSPVAHRLLACRAVEDAAGVEADERAALGRVGALERERAASHLGWLAQLGYLIGDRWMERQAAGLQLSLLRAPDAGEVGRLEPGVSKFIRELGRTPLLEGRLDGIGSLRTTEAAEALGPVARAGGFPTDARTDEQVYADLGFAPVVREGNDALSRLWTRLEEIEQSLDFVREAGAIAAPSLPGDSPLSGTGAATVETPRGAATLTVTLRDGVVGAARLAAPSTGHLGLVESVAVGKEVADALVGVASLDVSPWEV